MERQKQIKPEKGQGKMWDAEKIVRILDKMPAITPEEFPVLKRIRNRQHDIYACMSYSVAYGKMLGKQEERRRRKEKKQEG